MATYAIGDVQGCLGALRRLLDAFGFDRARDQLWFVGDLVNRGPDSLATLRLVRDFGGVAVTVLGNHDFHLLALAAGYVKAHRGDTLDAVLDAPDREELLAWLRQRPMLHVQGEWAMVHAGLLPQWSVSTAQMLAREVETALRDADWRQFLAQLYGDTPDSWNEGLRGADRLRVIVNAMARMRLGAPAATTRSSAATGPRWGCDCDPT
jgi:bis(5'-nucleosyl)-tetraphosphatase (symmetrical)